MDQFPSIQYSVRYLRNKCINGSTASLKDVDRCLICNMDFFSGHSADHALVSLTENIRSSLNNNVFGCGIFISLQKALDTVDHDILLSKREHCGIKGSSQSWFKSYLNDRKQSVC